MSRIGGCFKPGEACMSVLISCDPNGKIQHFTDLQEAGPLLAQKETTFWIDLVNPSPEELTFLEETFHFHPLALEDATRPHERPKVDSYPSYYFIIFYTAHYDQERERIFTLPISLFIGPNYLVSIHSQPIAQIDDTLRRWQVAHGPISNRVGALLYALLDAIVDDYFPVIDAIADRVELLEDRIFSHFDEKAIEQIFALKKDLLGLRRVASPQRDVLNVLLRREQAIFQVEDLVYLQDVYDHIVRVADSIDTYRDLLSSALDSFLSLQSNRLNQIVKVLTIASIVLMTDALIAGIYGMNFDHMPELHWAFGYPYSLLLMLLVSVGLVLLFRKMRWL
jgi:magnesium transporter